MRFAPGNLYSGLPEQLGAAGIDSQPPFIGGHLRAGNQTSNGGTGMRDFWVLLRREVASYFCSLTGYVIIAAIAFLTGVSFMQLISALGNDPWPMPVTQ